MRMCTYTYIRFLLLFGLGYARMLLGYAPVRPVASVGVM